MVLQEEYRTPFPSLLPPSRAKQELDWESQQTFHVEADIRLLVIIAQYFWNIYFLVYALLTLISMLLANDVDSEPFIKL